MKMNIKTIINNVQLILFIVFVFLWFISSKIQILRYISIGIFGLFCIIQSMKILKRKKIYVNNQIISYFLFTLFAGISVIWAMDSNLVITKFFDLICNSIFLLLSYDYFVNSDINLEKVLKIFMFVGFIFSLYILSSYGISNYFQLLLKGKRIGSDVINVNFIGIVSSLTFIIATYMIYNSLIKHKLLGILVLIITLIIALGSGSKKALFSILIGLILIFYFSFKNKLSYKNLIKIILAIIVCIVIFSFVYSSPYFSNIFDRIELMFNTLTDDSVSEGSTYVRIFFIQTGLKVFLQNPIGGIGLNNSGLLLSSYHFSLNTYLHCNYVELLACTGIIGFILYYYIHVKTMIDAFKNKNKNKHTNLILIIILVMLFLDVGAVSYYEIKTAFYLLLCFILNSKKKNYERN